MTYENRKADNETARNQKVLYSLLEKKHTQINTQIPQQREKMFGKAVSGVCSDMRALHSTHREREIDREWEIDREKERETERGVERSEWRAQKKKKQREPNQCWKSAYDRWQTR